MSAEATDVVVAVDEEGPQPPVAGINAVASASGGGAVAEVVTPTPQREEAHAGSIPLNDASGSAPPTNQPTTDASRVGEGAKEEEEGIAAAAAVVTVDDARSCVHAGTPLWVHMAAVCLLAYMGVMTRVLLEKGVNLLVSQAPCHASDESLVDGLACAKQLGAGYWLPNIVGCVVMGVFLRLSGELP